MSQSTDPSTPEPDLNWLAPPGWIIRRHDRRRWRLSHEQHVVAEFGVLFSGEWWVRPVRESLPWPYTYENAGAAVEALTDWWTWARPWSDDQF